MLDKEIVETIDKMPIDYKIGLNKTIRNALITFKENLINITLGGSGGKGNIIEGWSDLDLYIILNDYDVEQVAKFMNSIKDINVHVGTTYYTRNEIEKGIIDTKTKVMLFEMQKFDVNPILYGENVFKEIDYDDIKISDINNFPNVLHDMRRRYIELYNGKDLDKEYVKKLLVLVKCLLRSEDIFTYGYKYTFDTLFKKLSSENIELTGVEDFDIMYVINNMKDAKESVVNFSNFLLNYIENVYNKGGVVWKKELVLGR